MKKNRILIILLVFAICIVITLTILKLTYKSKTNDNEEFTNQLQTLINNINEINKSFENIDLNDNSKYENDSASCYKYNGDNKEKLINLLYNTYINPFGDDGVFELVSFETQSGETEEDLYLCIPDECEIKTIDNYSVVNDNEDNKIIQIGNGEYGLEKDDNNWKFVFPILNCKR